MKCVYVEYNMDTTLRLRSGIRKKLDAFKVHSTESYGDVVSRIADSFHDLHKPKYPVPYPMPYNDTKSQRDEE